MRFRVVGVKGIIRWPNDWFDPLQCGRRRWVNRDNTGHARQVDFKMNAPGDHRRRAPSVRSFLERDNPSEGVDSWSLGAISDHDIVAVVRRRLWPLRRGAGRV